MDIRRRTLDTLMGLLDLIPEIFDGFPNPYGNKDLPRPYDHFYLGETFFQSRIEKDPSDGYRIVIEWGDNWVLPLQLIYGENQKHQLRIGKIGDPGKRTANLFSLHLLYEEDHWTIFEERIRPYHGIEYLLVLIEIVSRVLGVSLFGDTGIPFSLMVNRLSDPKTTTKNALIWRDDVESSSSVERRKNDEANDRERNEREE